MVDSEHSTRFLSGRHQPEDGPEFPDVALSFSDGGSSAMM